MDQLGSFQQFPYISEQSFINYPLPFEQTQAQPYGTASSPYADEMIYREPEGGPPTTAITDNGGGFGTTALADNGGGGFRTTSLADNGGQGEEFREIEQDMLRLERDMSSLLSDNGGIGGPPTTAITDDGGQGRPFTTSLADNGGQGEEFREIQQDMLRLERDMSSFLSDNGGPPTTAFYDNGGGPPTTAITDDGGGFGTTSLADEGGFYGGGAYLA